MTYEIARAAFGCYLTFIIAVLIIAGLTMAYLFPDWTPLEALK